MQAIATAWYTDPYAGKLPAYLKPFKTRRHGRSAIGYRWQTDRGSSCGLIAMLNPKTLVCSAAHSPLFQHVAIALHARELFTA